MTSWFVGGPSYRMQTSAYHTTMMGTLGALWALRGDRVEWWYQHTSILPEGRADFLAQALASGADLALSVDSDTALVGDGAARLLTLLDEPWPKDVAMRAVLVPQRNGRVNAWKAEGVRLDEPLADHWTEAHAVGSALCAHRLAWYRHKPRLPTFEKKQSYCMMPTAGGTFVGEDVFHCGFVRRMGGRFEVAYLPGGVAHAGGF